MDPLTSLILTVVASASWRYGAWKQNKEYDREERASPKPVAPKPKKYDVKAGKERFLMLQRGMKLSTNQTYMSSAGGDTVAGEINTNDKIQ